MTVVCLPHTTTILSSLTSSLSLLLLLDYLASAIHSPSSLTSLLDDLCTLFDCILRTLRVEPFVHIV